MSHKISRSAFLIDLMIGNSAVNTLLCAYDKAILSNVESSMKMTEKLLDRMKTKVMAFQGTNSIRAKIVVDGTVLQ